MEDFLRKYGPVLAGALFGAGWWTWVDAVVCSTITVPFLHYLPGIGASFAGLMVNVVRREDLQQDYSPFDEDTCRSRGWLFLAYVIAFVSLAGATTLLILDAHTASTASSSWLPHKETISVWTGTAGVLQCGFVLGSGLIYWMSGGE
eukprot:TRINITY_DN32888_c0_g1_i1.p1 TRINITY_DN32888_c0_g1~~TRINITY_DN32888_c0_g1_i1.p1  ORF type:complete len:147 (+),score=23.56 TRINITY_DN32888_c0_g1_i1:194-634(+)